MSIAGKAIAGSSPIAGGAGYTPPMYTVFWGPTSEVFAPVLGISLETVFWGPTAQVFKMVLVDPNAGEADCILVPPHLNAMVAYPVCDMIAPAYIDDIVATPHDNEATVTGFQDCNKKEAA